MDGGRHLDPDKVLQADAPQEVFVGHQGLVLILDVPTLDKVEEELQAN